MRDRTNMEDLLRSQRRRRGGRRWRWWLAGAAVIGFGIWWFLYMRETDEDREQRHTDVVEQARAIVEESRRAARRPLEVDAPAENEDRQTEEALTATWTDGEAVSMEGKIAKNESITQSLSGRGVPRDKIQKVVSVTGEKFDFRRSRPGDEWRLEVDDDGKITKFEYQSSPEDIWETVRNSNGSYSCTKLEVPVEHRKATLGGQVNKSLWMAFKKVAEDNQLIYRFADIFAYTVDFNRESQPGDRFALVVDKVYLDDQFLRYGKIRAAEYVNQGVSHRAFLHETDDGKGYYNQEGENLKRQFLKSPLASIRVTSRYGMRYHPVEGRKKMHRGVDYGAPRGTPIRAVADGRVQYAGHKGANGNLIVLSHANGYTTLYAHLSEIADGIRPGKRVTKKTVIGEVGNTGRSTGPHLHFGMKRNGTYVNPQEVDFARGEPLKGEEKKEFRRETVNPLLEDLKKARTAWAKAGDGDSSDTPGSAAP